MKSKGDTWPLKFLSNQIHQTHANWEHHQSLLASLLVSKPLKLTHRNVWTSLGQIESLIILLTNLKSNQYLRQLWCWRQEQTLPNKYQFIHKFYIIFNMQLAYIQLGPCCYPLRLQTSLQQGTNSFLLNVLLPNIKRCILIHFEIWTTTFQ